MANPSSGLAIGHWSLEIEFSLLIKDFVDSFLVTGFVSLRTTWSRSSVSIHGSQSPWY